MIITEFMATVAATLLGNALSALFIFAVLTGVRSERQHGDLRDLTTGLCILGLLGPMIGAGSIWLTVQTTAEARHEAMLQQSYSASSPVAVEQ